MAKCQKWKPVIVILVVYFALAVMNILFKRILNEGKSQLVIVTYRLTISTIFLTPIAYFSERRKRVKLTTPIILHLFISGLVGATLTQYLYLLGIQYTSAAFASAFINLNPGITFLFAFLLREENVKLRSKGGIAKVLGSLICIGGVILLILYRGIPLNKTVHSGNSFSHANKLSAAAKGNIISTQGWIKGSIFLVLSMIFWSLWFLIQARINKKYPCKYSSTSFMSFFGAIQSAILCLAINRDISLWILTGKLQMLTVLFAGIVGSGLCYVGMSWCVEQRGAVFTSAFSPFIQIFTTILDLAFFHEQIYLGSVVGSMVVICGLYILLWGKSKSSGTVDNTSTQADVVECNGSSGTASDVAQITSI